MFDLKLKEEGLELHQDQPFKYLTRQLKNLTQICSGKLLNLATAQKLLMIFRTMELQDARQLTQFDKEKTLTSKTSSDERVSRHILIRSILKE